MALRSWRSLASGQVSRLVVFDVATGDRTLVYESGDAVFEAPNWVVSPHWGDDEWLVVNQDGLMYRLPVDGLPDGTSPILVPTGDIDSSNNDHVVSPDGHHLYISAEDKHIHEVSLADGTARRVTHDHDQPFNHYLHGISPDGRTLSYIGLEPLGPNPGPGTPALTNVFTIGIDGADDTQLTFSDKPHDGAELDPSGEWIYFNSERASDRPGHAQLFRCRPDGSDIRQLTFDERVNWFPHVAPGGRDLVYVSYPAGVLGHPADEEVLLRRIDPEGGAPTDLVALHGGQGTMNVASWSPDGTRFAYVEYPA
ncbi:biopolymer transporter Tol [Planctomonas sp. JC2975]|uniref:TolB family protein n=1 Tax=Planctomonas sp. JC2975 TaxID=2729626 RepID=UPI0014731472|nr:PD40 domain-containing protein [Planctomonas sp. JC2975]NNC12329.1 biopolymer transporter Tol [Planctomonas sp. JC2975]